MTARERWPELVDEIPANFDGYRREIEARTKRIQQNMPGQLLYLSPLTISGLESFASEQEQDPGTAECRGAYAAQLFQLGESFPWPPSRNDPCWCGSGRKYKVCCGPVPVATTPPVAAGAEPVEHQESEEP